MFISDSSVSNFRPNLRISNDSGVMQSIHVQYCRTDTKLLTNMFRLNTERASHYPLRKIRADRDSFLRSVISD